MSYQLLEQEGEVRRVRNGMISAFREHGAKEVRATVGWRGERFSYKLLWAEKSGIWCMAKPSIGGTHKDHYWNPFGTKDPRSGPVTITCEINLPINGRKRNVQGGVAANEKGDKFLVHRGSFTAGKHISPESFRSQYDGSWLSVWDGDRETDMAAVAEIGSRRFVPQLWLFVSKVEQIKNLAKLQGGEAALSKQSQFEIASFGDEFAGTKTYFQRQRVISVCDHGLVVNKLRELLRKAGYFTGKDGHRDLYVHNGRQVTSLFEVKPSVDSQSIYSAVGQLLMYSVPLKPRPRLFFVAPEEMSTMKRHALRQIGIEFLAFRWKQDEPVFPDLKNQRF